MLLMARVKLVLDTAGKDEAQGTIHNLNDQVVSKNEAVIRLKNDVQEIKELLKSQTVSNRTSNQRLTQWCPEL